MLPAILNPVTSHQHYMGWPIDLPSVGTVVLSSWDGLDESGPTTLVDWSFRMAYNPVVTNSMAEADRYYPGTLLAMSGWEGRMPIIDPVTIDADGFIVDRPELVTVW